MGSFFKNLRSNNGPLSPTSNISSPKKDNHVLPITPLEKMLQDSGPVRADGSDKFFGMENYGNTCYCNSILQCLYYSVPFRESVINYPKRTPIESLEMALARNLRYQSPEAFFEAEAAAAKAKHNAGQSSSRNAGVTPTQPPKPEDKDSPEYKKKVAIQTLPLLETKDNSASYGMSESLFTSLKDLFENVVASQSKLGVVRPQHFLEVLRRENEMFRTAMHQDAHEFLNLLLNEVVTNVEAESAKQIENPPVETTDSEQTVAVTDSSTNSTGTQVNGSTGSKTPNTTRWVHELFEGTLTSETQCLTCEKVSQRDEVFLDLSVDLEQHSSVTSCLRKFSAEEMLCERNKFHCDNCGGLQEAEKRMKIKRLPKILALHLKRFKYTEDLQRLQKLFHRVVYPYHLRLFNTTDDAEDPDRLYELYAVVVHIGGGPYHGHYVSIIKTEDRGWLLFDDEMVEPVDKSYVRNFFGDRPGLACAYVLFYQETTLEAVQREQEQEGYSAAGAADLREGNLSSPLNHIHTYTGPSEDEAHHFAPLRTVPTAPQMSTHPEHAFSTSPPAPPVPQIPVDTGVSKKSEGQSRKERVKEEKGRKAAEKEKEKADKQKRKEQEAKRREDLKREDADMKAALELSKASKAEEDRKTSSDNGENGQHKMLTGSLNRFRRSSKSLSHRFASPKDGSKRAASSEFSRSDIVSDNGHPPDMKLHEHVIEEDVPTESNNHSTIPQTVTQIHELVPKSKADKPDKDKGNKWKGFGIRKKSMSLLG
ncbi:ubiquitin C-terminal hydrolase CreB [Talaromyces stipitatus ATCC 10500]|uniref:Ubiquitin carboxyl-terminal hydrolase n=1 Tax=Talaromyces stipitatus (strain ATCC 10500 / CBS 375.48 / QM 6759 / NRRL 1006) TaxID=441959 RepID=B8LXN7_TALSN|nr:ubiquitin C-terminal hydrolase CreB [Talaromyces stipitatus ATCC 10500]EED24538.1 ubiquitin C-terminal hydrolase CreB [Talaromyces stipitatus ATCC 10500]